MKLFTRNVAPWFATAAAGVALALYADPPIDTDNDGMPDAFESFFGLDANSSADASGNGDTDQHSNVQESARWTDPFASDTDLDGWPDHADTNALSRAVMHWGAAQFTDGDSYDYTGPDWFLGATKFNGTWISNSWDVAATETNAASLNLYLDRVLLTNAVRMAVTLMDRPGAGLEVDLLNTNGTAVATNLVGNLITGGGIELRRKVMVDLPAFPDGVFISLRRSAGHVTVYDTVLYVDDDDDGLDQDQEAQLGTSDLLTDSDADGFNDGYEYRVGTDPISSTSKPLGPLTLLLPPDTTVEYGQSTAPAATGTASAETSDGSPATLSYSDLIVDPVTLLPLRNSGDWAWKYDMSAAPNNMNLDGTGGDDWWDTAAPTVAGGTANGGAGLLYRGDFNGSIWRSGIGNGNYSLEFLLQLSSTGAEGSMGSFGFFGEKPADAHQGLRLNIKRSGQTASNGATVQYPLGDQDNTGAFHRFRIARSAPGRYEIWRDDERLNTVPVVGGNNANDNGIFLGAFSSNLSGGWQLDDLRLTPGAYAPDTPVGRLLQRTWTAVGAGTSISAVQRITIQDTTPPVVYGPPDLTSDMADPTTPGHTGWATAWDQLDPAPVVAWSDTDVESGLELFVPLDENGPPYQDRGGRGPAFSGAGAPVTGRVGRAMTLTGSAAPVSVPNLLPTAQTRSISLWFRTTSGVKSMLYSFEGVVFAYLENGRLLPAFDGSSTGDPWWGQGLHDGQWHHLLAMNDGATTTLLIDGVPAGSRPETSGDLNSYNRTSALGAQYNGQSFRFAGDLDEVTVWNRGLDHQEAVLLAAGGESTLIRRAWTATDASGNQGGAVQWITRTGLLVDTDGDGLTNRDEEFLGTNPALADTDGDGLSDGAEILTHHTNPLSGDSDGDGLDDSWEITWGQNPLSNDASADDDGDHLGAWIEYYGLNPTAREDIQVSTAKAATHSATGAVWTAVGDSMRLVDPRGWIEFPVVLPDPDLYVFVIHGRAAVSSAASETFQLQVSLDGAPIGTHSLTSVNGQPGWVSGIIPWTAPGTYTLRIFVDNHSSHRAFQLDQIDILRIDDTDDNTNGLKDWIDSRFDQENLVHPPPPQVSVSPLCLEGVVEYLDRMTVSVGTNTVEVLPGVDDGWYANVPLLPEGSTPIEVAFEDGGRVVTQSVEWVALNAMTVSNLVLRVNDTLRFTAFTGEEPATNAVLTVTLPNGATTNLAAGAEIDWPFPEAGNRTLRVIESLDGLSTTNVVQIAVKSATFGAPIAVHVGKSRAWTLGSVPEDVPVTADLDLSFLRDPLLLTRTYNVTTPAAGSHYVIARTGDGGPVLAHGRVDAFLIASSSDTRVETIGFYADGSRLVEMDVIAGTLPAGVEVRLEIFVAGVTFDDGTTLKILGPSDFDEFGVAKVRFIKPAWTTTSVCHRMHFYQNGVYLGTR